MKCVISSSVRAPAAALVICAALATQGHAWSWPWEQDSATTAPQSNGDEEAAPTNSMSPAAEMQDNRHRTDPSKFLGTVENVDAENHRFILKTGAGKSKSFRLAGPSVVVRHRRKLTLSSLRAGEVVIVHCRPGTNAAVRVYILGDEKA